MKGSAEQGRKEEKRGGERNDEQRVEERREGGKSRPRMAHEGAADGPGWSQDGAGGAHAGTGAFRVAKAVDQECQG